MFNLEAHFKATYFGIRSAIGSDSRRVKKVQAAGKVPVLNLHRVSPESNPYWSPLEPRLFESLLVYLKKKFRLVTFKELEESPLENTPRAILSFDDGYLDFMQYAMPILKKHSIRANMNIISAASLGKEPPWNAMLYDFLQHAPAKLLRELKIPGFTRTFDPSSQTSKRVYGQGLSRYLKSRPRAEREVLWGSVSRTIELWRSENARPRSMMNVAEIRQAAAEHEIGVHSYSHESMGYEESSFFEADYQQCLDFFDKVLQLPLYVYAFPNGSYRPEQVQYLLKHGIRHVLLVDENFSIPDNHVHPRFTIGADSSAQLKFQALGDRVRNL